MSPGGLRGLQNRCEACRTSWVCSIRTHLRQSANMQYQTFFVIGFFSSYHSFEAERIALEAGLSVRIIPRPKEVGGNLRCGNALRFKPKDKEKLYDLLHKHAIKHTDAIAIQDF